MVAHVVVPVRGGWQEDGRDAERRQVRAGPDFGGEAGRLVSEVEVALEPLDLDGVLEQLQVPAGKDAVVGVGHGLKVGMVDTHGQVHDGGEPAEVAQHGHDGVCLLDLGVVAGLHACEAVRVDDDGAEDAAVVILANDDGEAGVAGVSVGHERAGVVGKVGLHGGDDGVTAGPEGSGVSVRPQGGGEHARLLDGGDDVREQGDVVQVRHCANEAGVVVEEAAHVPDVVDARVGARLHGVPARHTGAVQCDCGAVGRITEGDTTTAQECAAVGLEAQAGCAELLQKDAKVAKMLVHKGAVGRAVARLRAGAQNVVVDVGGQCCWVDRRRRVQGAQAQRGGHGDVFMVQRLRDARAVMKALRDADVHAVATVRQLKSEES